MENKIFTTKSTMMIVPYKKGISRSLENMNSDYDEVYHRKNEVSGFIVPYEGKVKCYLAPYVNPNNFGEDFIDYEIESMPETKARGIEPFELKPGESLTDIQIDLVQKIMNGRDRYTMLNHRWYINLDTGYGKTLLALYIASQLRYKTMVVCGSKKVLSQWGKALCEKFTIDPTRIIHIDDGRQITGILDGKISYFECDVFIVGSSLISSYGNRKGWKCISDLMGILGIGCLIVDEAHRCIGNTVRMTACANIKFVQFLSADFGQGNYKREKKFWNIFASVPVIKPDDNVREDMHYTVGIIVKFDSTPSATESQMAIYNRYGFDANKYMQYEIKKGAFIKALIWLIKKINKANSSHRQILILFTNVWAVDEVKGILEDSPELSGKTVSRYHGSIPDEERDMYRYTDIIVATYASFSTGIDINTIKYVIGTNQSNKIEDNQTAGRAGRKYNIAEDNEVFYMMMVDEGFKYCKRKLPSRINYLKDMKFKKVVQVQYYDKEIEVDDPGEII